MGLLKRRKRLFPPQHTGVHRYGSHDGRQDDEGPYSVKGFNGPGVYKLPVRAIKQATDHGVAVDSATVLVLDNAFLAQFTECYEWEKAMDKRGSFNFAYHQQVAEKIGTRFGICSPPPRKFKSAFIGDGCCSIYAKAIEAAKL